jgi:hypothetical protein
LYFAGYGILTAAWLFTLKSVRYLILRKGGDKVTFVTYTPFGKNRMMTVDVNKVNIFRNSTHLEQATNIAFYSILNVESMKLLHEP